MKKWIAMLLALVMVLSLAACGTQNDGGEQNQQPDSSNNAQQPEDTQTPDPSQEPELNNEVVEYYFQKANEVEVTDTHVTFTDDGSGQVVSIEKDPQKAAVLYGSLVCLWYEAGGTAPLTVGGKSASTLYKEQIGRDITQDADVKVITESSSGTAWDVEAILAEQPDLIVTSVGMKGYSTIAEPAAAVGIPAIGVNYDGVQDYLKWFKVFCNLNGQPELWDAIAEKTANDIISIVSNTPKEGEVPTCVILTITSDTLKAYTYDSQTGVMAAELGGVNLVDPDNSGTSSTVEISLEDIYALDPDIIFYSERDRTGESRAKLDDMVGRSPVWQELRAVKDGKVFNLEMGLFFNKANMRYNEAYLAMAQFLYPDVDFGVEIETAAAGLTLTEENGVLTCFDAETSPFEDCAVRVTVDKSAKTVTFVKATTDGQDTKEYYKYMPEEHMMEQFYYVSMMGTGFYYYYDTELGEMVRMEDMNHEDSTQSAKDNGRFDGPAERIKGEAAALEDYFAASFGMTIAEAVQ